LAEEEINFILLFENMAGWPFCFDRDKFLEIREERERITKEGERLS